MATQRFRLALDRPAVGHSIIQALEKSRHSKTIFRHVWIHLIEEPTAVGGTHYFRTRHAHTPLFR